MSASSTSPISFKSGLYWQKNPILGFLSEPVILTLSDGMLKMSTRKDLVFDVPVSEAEAKFSKMGTMSLTVSGKRYSIAGIGGTLAPKFTPAQQQEVAAAIRAEELDAQRPTGTAGTVTPAMSQVFSQWKTMTNSVGVWRDIFAANGVRVAGS